MDPTQALAELQVREPIFHRPELGTARADFERMTADDFWEIGASGKIYTREEVLDLLEERHSGPQAESLVVSAFRVRQLGLGLYLAHYDLVQEHTRKTRRTTLWRHSAEGWKIVFHQGTIVGG